MHIFSCNCYPEEDCEGGSGLIYCSYAGGVSNFLYIFFEGILPDTERVILGTLLSTYNINIL